MYFIAIDEVADGIVSLVLLHIELLVVSDVVGVRYDIGVELQFDAGGVPEITVAVYVMADVSGVFDGIEFCVYEASLMGQHDDG